MQCVGIKAGGGQCRNAAHPPSEYCSMHDPKRAEERREYATRGGKVKALRAVSPMSTELARLQGVFEQLAQDVLEGRQDRSAAAVAIQALNGARGCIVGALKAQEQEQMAAELAEITQMLQERGLKKRRA